MTSRGAVGDAQDMVSIDHLGVGKSLNVGARKKRRDSTNLNKTPVQYRAS
jgi:hypothetical protein